MCVLQVLVWIMLCAVWLGESQHGGRMEREEVARGLGPLSQSSTGSGGELVTDGETTRR